MEYGQEERGEEVVEEIVEEIVEEVRDWGLDEQEEAK